MCKRGLLSFQGKIKTISPDFPGKMIVSHFWPYFSTCPSLKSGFLTQTKIIFLKWAIIGLFAGKFHNVIFKIVHLVATWIIGYFRLKSSDFRLVSIFTKVILAPFYTLYTLLQNKIGRFENWWRKTDILYIILKGILWKFRFSLNFSKIFWFRDFMSKFPRKTPNGSGMGVRKNFRLSNMNILHIALKHVIWRFWICNYFREICNFRGIMNNLGNSRNLFCSYFAKFKYLAESLY